MSCPVVSMSPDSCDSRAWARMDTAQDYAGRQAAQSAVDIDWATRRPLVIEPLAPALLPGPRFYTLPGPARRVTVRGIHLRIIAD